MLRKANMKKQITPDEIDYVLRSKYLTDNIISIMYKYGYSSFLTSCYTGLMPRQYVLRKFKNFVSTIQLRG